MYHNVRYHWPRLAPEGMPSGVLITAISDGSGREISYFSTPVFAAANGEEWTTESSLEVAFDAEKGAARVMWKSGLPPTKGFPDNYVSDWIDCSDPADALDRVTRRLTEEGRPVVGISRMPHPTVSYYPPIPVIW